MDRLMLSNPVVRPSLMVLLSFPATAAAQEAIFDGGDDFELPLDWVDVGSRLEAADGAVRAIFDPDSHPLCRPGARARRPTRAGCDLLRDVDPELCPGAATYCAAGPLREEPRDDPSIGWWGLGLVAAVALALIGWWVIRQLWGEGSLRRPESVAAAREPAQETPRRLPEEPAPMVLERARRRLEAGDSAAAIALVQLALQRWIQDAGILAFQPSLTHRDYLSRLRSHPELRTTYAGVARATGRLWFGDGQVEPARVRELHDRARVVVEVGQVPKAPLAGAISGLLLVASGVACGGGEGFEPSFHRHGPRDLAALPALLARIGIPVDVVSDRLPDDLTGVGLVVYRRRASDWVVPTSWLDEASGLGYPIVILDDAAEPGLFFDDVKTSTRALPRSTAWELYWGSACGLELERIEVQLGSTSVRLTGVVPLRLPYEERRAGWFEVPLGVRSSTTASIDDETSLLTFGLVRTTGDATDQASRFGCRFYFASSAPFSNAALLQPGNRALAVALIGSLLREEERVVILDGPGSGASEGATVTGALGRTRSTPLFLHGLLGLILVLWAMGLPFGPLRDPTEDQRRAFLDHARALGAHYERSGVLGEIHVVRVLAKAIVRRWQHRVPAHDVDGWVALARELAREHDADGDLVVAAIVSGLEGREAERLRAHTPLGDPMESARVLSLVLAGPRGAETGVRT